MNGAAPNSPDAARLITPTMLVVWIGLATIPLWISKIGLYPYLGIEILIWSIYALAFNLVLVVSGLMTILLNNYRDFSDLVASRAEMARKQAETQRLSDEAKLRNKYNHCIYSFDPDSGRNLTQSMRIFESRDEIKYGKIEELDVREIGRIQSSINSLIEINHMLWSITERYDFPK